MVEVKRYDAIKTNFAGYPKRAPRSDAEDLPSSKSLRLEKMEGSGTHAGGHLILYFWNCLTKIEICSVCEQKYEDRMELMQHMRQHNAVRWKKLTERSRIYFCSFKGRSTARIVEKLSSKQLIWKFTCDSTPARSRLSALFVGKGSGRRRLSTSTCGHILR